MIVATTPQARQCRTRSTAAGAPLPRDTPRKPECPPAQPRLLPRIRGFIVIHEISCKYITKMPICG